MPATDWAAWRDPSTPSSWARSGAMRWRRWGASTLPSFEIRTTNSTGGLRARGETVWFDPGLVVTYRPRDTLRGLAWQYFNYGRWKRVVARRHPASLLPRHLASPLLAAGIGRHAGPGRGRPHLGGSGSAAHVRPHPDAQLSGGRPPSPFIRRAPAPAGPRNHAPELGSRFLYPDADQDAGRFDRDRCPFPLKTLFLCCGGTELAPPLTCRCSRRLILSESNSQIGTQRVTRHCLDPLENQHCKASFQ